MRSSEPSGAAKKGREAHPALSGLARNRYPLPLMRSNPIAPAAEIVCQHWTLLIVREVMMGRRRFDEIRDELGIATNTLATRLRGLVADGVLQRVPYRDRPVRAEYRLTDKGRDLRPLIVALQRWAERHAASKSSS